MTFSRSEARPAACPSRHRSSARERAISRRYGPSWPRRASNASGRRQRRGRRPGRRPGPAPGRRGSAARRRTRRGGARRRRRWNVLWVGGAPAAMPTLYTPLKVVKLMCRVRAAAGAPATIGAMANPDRLTGLDASFLALEDGGAHMHVGSVLLFDGERARLRRVRRPGRAAARARPALPPEARVPAAAQAARSGSTTRTSTPATTCATPRCPPPRARPSCARLAGRVFAQRLDRSKPLWELWLVDRVGEDRFAIISKTHHCLVDGISGVDIATVLFDLEPDPPAPAPRRSRGSRVPSRRARRCSPRRSRNAVGARRDRPRRGRCRAPPAAALGAAAHAAGGLAAITQAGIARRAALPAQRAHRPAPSLRVGRRRARRPQGRSRTRSAARSTTSSSRSWPARCARTPRARLRHGRRAARDGARLGARRVRARRARQPRLDHLRAAARSASTSRSRASAPCTRRCGG